MKILTLIFIINTVVYCDVFKEFAERNNVFSKKLHGELGESNKGNFIVSPLSLDKTLALTALGAKGGTLSELEKLLGISVTDREIKQQYDSLETHMITGRFSTLTSANKIYVEKGFGIAPQYLQAVSGDFHAEVENLNFGDASTAANKINRWIDEKTGGNIKDLVTSDDLNELTTVVLVNALYFKAQWVHIFQETNTKPGTFYRTENETVDVDTMENVAYLKHATNDNLNAVFVELPYRGTEVVCTIVLPNEIEGLGVMEKNLDAVLQPQNYTRDNVKLFLPKFRVESSFNLIPTLRKLGVKKLFNRDADLSGMSIKEGLYVSNVVQKVFLNINEIGTEAAAATAVISNSRSGHRVRKPRLEIKVDRPFLFFLKLKDIVLFSGRISTL